MKRGAIVLCGGRSTRMGRDKATLPFGDEVLLQRVVRLLRPVVEETVIVARPGQTLPTLDADVRVARDEVLDQGPLGGMLPGLSASTADAAYVTGCDVPFLHVELVDLLFRRLGASDVAVAEAEGFLHPMTSVVRPRVKDVIVELLAGTQRRPLHLYERVATTRVGEEELRGVDPRLETLENLNTEDAYEAALGRYAPPRIRIELYETARGLAGTDHVDVQARTLGEALEFLGRRCPALEGDVVSRGRPTTTWRASVNAGVFADDPLTPLADGDAIVLVSALAGG